MRKYVGGVLLHVWERMKCELYLGMIKVVFIPQAFARFDVELWSQL